MIAFHEMNNQEYLEWLQESYDQYRKEPPPLKHGISGHTEAHRLNRRSYWLNYFIRELDRVRHEIDIENRISVIGEQI